MDLTTCSAWALAGSAGGVAAGFCMGTGRGAGNRRGTRRGGGGRTMRAWPGRVRHGTRRAGDRRPPDAGGERGPEAPRS